MVIDKKGREILKKSDFAKFRQELIENIIQKISTEGKYGSELREYVEESLKEDIFLEFVDKLYSQISKESTFNNKNIDKTAETLIEEDIAKDVKKILHGQLNEEKDSHISEEEKKFLKKGVDTNLWNIQPGRKLLGRKTTRIKDISKLFREHPALKYPIILGIIFLVISALLFGSIYKAVIVGLTLTSFTSDSVKIMLANILGGFGGLLLFFTSITIIFQLFLMSERRNIYIQELARRYLNNEKL